MGAVGVRGVCHPTLTDGHKWPCMHDLYVNDKDRQELADAALWPAVTGFLSWGWLGTRGDCPLLANLCLLRPPPPPLRVVSCGLARPPSVHHQNSSRTGRFRYAGSLWPFTMASRNGNITAGFGCGDEFLGVWMGPLKFTFCCQGVLFLHLLTDRAAGAVVDKMTTWELTRPLPTSGQKAGFCFSVPLALQCLQLGNWPFGRGGSIPHFQNQVLRSHNVLHRSGRTHVTTRR